MINFKKKEATIVKASKNLVDYLLSLNTDNRNVRKGHVKWIVESIKNDNFVLTGQGISISKNGLIIDGQHRLLAIQEAGYPPVELLLVTGLEEKSRIYVDQHAKRSAADMLKIVLNKNVTNRMTALLNLHLKIKETKEGFVIVRGRPALDRMVEEMAQHMEICSLIIDAAGSKARAGILCGLFHYAIKFDEDRAVELAEKFRLGEGLRKFDPSYKLRQYVFDKKSIYGGSGTFMDYKYTISACVSDALNLEIQMFRPLSSWDELPPKLKRHYVKKVA